jgi:hypothetical protein
MSTTSPNAAPLPEPKPVEKPKKTNWELLLEEIFGTGKKWEDIEKALQARLPLVIADFWNPPAANSYNLILSLDQSNLIGEDHADRIYSALCGFKEKRNVLLVIGSRGGRIEPAYLISKNCKAVSKDKFVVVVPRRAKSAATLLTLGADEIHMGSMSELGPIDPQLGHMPALSLTNALQTLARLVSEYPGSTDMFSKFLQSKLDLSILGYFERINESAVQYASRLLEGKSLGQGQSGSKLASHLVNHYKDHSFVIDKDEAAKLFGTNIIKTQTPEYTAANALDQNLRLISRIIKWVYKKELTFVGSTDSCIKVRDVEEKVS